MQRKGVFYTECHGGFYRESQYLTFFKRRGNGVFSQSFESYQLSKIKLSATPRKNSPPSAFKQKKLRRENKSLSVTPCKTPLPLRLTKC
jgi:hypothetical protein